VPQVVGGDGVSVRGENLTVVVGDGLTILQPTTLTLPAGTMTAIVGPSGCGKSTLANLLSGRSEPTTGTVSIDGVAMDPAVRTRIGVVPQYDAVHQRLTVRRALEAAAFLRRPPNTPRAEIAETVQTTAELLDLDDRLDTRIVRLSGGQKKRVSVGYELVAEPVMMVLDEPTSGLDPGLEQDLIDELRQLADRGTTTVLVTHSPEAATEADLVIVLAPGGYLTYLGPPDRVLDYFGVDDWADVFGRLDAETGPEWAEHLTGTALHDHYIAAEPDPPSDPLRAETLARPAPRAWAEDWRVMVVRYLRSIGADWRSLALLAAQAPVLGLLFAAVLSTRAFVPSLQPTTRTREFVLAVVLAMAWIGASNSIREIVKERSTFLRERAFGVAPSALVASRWLVLGLITVVQSVVLYLAATSRQQEPPGTGVLLSSGTVELMASVVLIGLASVGLGLVVSGLVSDANRAMAILPLVLIPVILFSGLLIPVTGRIGVEQVSYLNPIQWGASAAASTTDLLAQEGCNPTGFEAQLQEFFLGRTITCTNTRWQPTVATQVVNFAGALGGVALLVWLSFVATARSTRRLRG
jgi:ABC-type multidrug transport system ATPase subunit